jgi:hypothetical protein
MLKNRIAVLAFGLFLSVAVSANAADPKTVADGLDNPTGLAVQPGTGHVFIASHAGVHRLDPKTGTVTAEVTGYPDPTDVYGKGPKYPIGPLGLAFVDESTLVVGGGSRKDGAELVRIFKVGATAAAKPQAEDKAAYTLGPITASDKTAKGEGNFYGVATNGQWIFITCNGDDTKGWVAKARIKDGKPGKLQLAIATKEATEVDAPGPVTFNKSKKGIIVGQIGEVTIPGDSLVTFYSANGKMLRNLTTGLNDLAGLAYSPKTGKLYGTDFSWVDATKGGLFQLIIKKDAKEAKTKKIVGLDKPTGLAFDAEGNCYIAVFGAVEGDKPTGKVICISGL